MCGVRDSLMFLLNMQEMTLSFQTQQVQEKQEKEEQRKQAHMGAVQVFLFFFNVFVSDFGLS